MRVIVIAFAASLLALTFAATPAQADNVTGTLTRVGPSCFELELTIINDDPGPPVVGLAVTVALQHPAGPPKPPCPSDGPELPPGWSLTGAKGGPGERGTGGFGRFFLAADSNAFAVPTGQSLSGFVFTVPTCSFGVGWSTFSSREQLSLDSGSVDSGSFAFAVPCP